MLNLPPSVKLWACTEPEDFRKSFSGLSQAVRSVMRDDPLSGHVFCFFNRRRDQMRLLYWDRSGYVLVGKRLEKGRFKVPWEPGTLLTEKWELEPSELVLILEGIELKGSRRRRRWSPSARGRRD